MSDFKTLLAVGDMVTAKVVQVEVNETIIAAAKKMSAEKTTSLLVVDADGKLSGIVTEGDIVIRAVAASLDVNKTIVKNIMTPNPVSIPSDESIFEAKKLMIDNKVNHLIVVKDGKPFGILTSQAILGS
jgi:CBS domain-containing protein